MEDISISHVWPRHPLAATVPRLHALVETTAADQRKGGGSLIQSMQTPPQGKSGAFVHAGRGGSFHFFLQARHIHRFFFPVNCKTAHDMVKSHVPPEKYMIQI
jgi:hypothetical protein